MKHIIYFIKIATTLEEHSCVVFLYTKTIRFGHKQR